MPLTRRAATGLILAGLATPAFGRTVPVPVKIPTRGFALPDWLATQARVPATALLMELRARGFESIRLPVDPAYVTPSTLTGILDVLTAVTGFGFNVILDLHPGGDLEPDQVIRAWDLLAPVLADTPPDKVYAELLNEPSFEPRAWRSLRDRLAGDIDAVEVPGRPIDDRLAVGRPADPRIDVMDRPGLLHVPLEPVGQRLHAA